MILRSEAHKGDLYSLASHINIVFLYITSIFLEVSLLTESRAHQLDWLGGKCWEFASPCLLSLSPGSYRCSSVCAAFVWMLGIWTQVLLDNIHLTQWALPIQPYLFLYVGMYVYALFCVHEEVGSVDVDVQPKDSLLSSNPSPQF